MADYTRYSDSVSTYRGMAAKIFGVDGPALPGHEAWYPGLHLRHRHNLSIG